MPPRGTSSAITLLAVLLAVAAGCRDDPPRLLEPDDELARVEAWQRIYDEVGEHPHLPRARRVFERMQDVVGSRADLVLLETGRSPRALALPDRTVILSRSGLELCYGGVSPELGDARLAFLLGHELYHVAADDFWHASALDAVRDAGDEDETLRRLQVLLEQDGRDRQVLELRADEAGILAAVQAGHDVTPLLEGDRTFFEEWVGGPDGSLAYADPDHPGPAERAAFLQRQLAEVTDRTELFHQGVAAFREAETLAAGAGGREVLPDVEAKYEEAADRFDRFRRHFPGREVLSDLALSHLRLAANHLARCDGTLVTRYYLPTVLDPVTLAERRVNRGAGDYSSPCFENDDYQRHMREATRLLEDAVDQDPGYLAARLNLVAAFVLDEQPARAAYLAGETLERFPDDSRAAAAWGAAHLKYLETGATVFDPDKVFNRIEEHRRAFPDEPGVAFNLASGLSHLGRLEEARPVWEAFLALEPDGPWAKIARGWVGDGPSDPADRLAPAAIPWKPAPTASPAA